MMGWATAAGQWLSRQSGALWRRNLCRQLGASLRLVCPLARRHVARHRLQSALLAVVVSVAVAAYILLTAVGATASRQAAAQVLPLGLPADLLAYAPGPLPADIDRRVFRVVEIDYWEPVAVAEVYTASGRYTALGLRFDSRLVAGLSLTSGRWPVGRPPGGVHGHAVFPDTAGGMIPGMVTTLGVPGQAGWHEVRVLVTGLYHSPGAPVSGPLVSLDALALLGEAVHGGVVGWLGPGYTLRSAVAKLGGLFAQGVVITRDTPQELARSLTRRSLSPVRAVMGLVVTLAAAGLFNLMLFSFLRRKRYLGTLKALGLESSELGLLLVAEAGFMSFLGMFGGWVLASGLIWGINRYNEPALRLEVGALAASAWLAAGALVLGSWIPVTLTRRATVDQLLYNRRVYLNPNPSCAQCGRCGGF